MVHLSPRYSHPTGGGGASLLAVTEYATAPADYSITTGTPVPIDAVNLTQSIVVPANGKVIFEMVGVAGLHGPGSEGYWLPTLHGSAPIVELHPCVVVLTDFGTGTNPPGGIFVDVTCYVTGLAPGPLQWDWSWHEITGRGSTFLLKATSGYPQMRAWSAP